MEGSPRGGALRRGAGGGLLPENSTGRPAADGQRKHQFACQRRGVPDAVRDGDSGQVCRLLFAPLHAYYNVSYYRYNDTIYANTRHSWYEYEDYGYGGDYEKVSKSSIPDDVLANKTDYQFNYNDDNEWTSNFTEFEDSSYYDEHYTSDSDSDSSYDWDSGDSWDSGTTDWDSDW